MISWTRLLAFKIWGLLIVLLFTIGIGAAHAQFLDLSLDIDSKLSAKTEQALNFGELISNTGRSNIDIGHQNMGVFSITALENQLLLVSMGKPNNLYHVNTAITDKVPVELFARYGYTYKDYENSYPLSGSSGSIKVEESPTPGPWNSIYFFIYGSVTIGDIAGGEYRNDLVLNVEYL